MHAFILACMCVRVCCHHAGHEQTISRRKRTTEGRRRYLSQVVHHIKWYIFIANLFRIAIALIIYQHTVIFKVIGISLHIGFHNDHESH